MSNSSSIARSLTTRINRKRSVAEHGSPISANGSVSSISRAFSMRKPERAPLRPEISLPIELLSATNPLAFNAPDIHAQSNSATAGFSPLQQQQLASTPSSSSLRSDNSSLPGLSSSSSLASPGGAGSSSGISTPVNEIPEHEFMNLQNRLTALPEREDEVVIPKAQTAQATTSNANDFVVLDAPAIPKRAPSHTKRTHQALARQRSISRMRSSSASTDASVPSLTGDNVSRKSSSSSSTNHHLSMQSGKDNATVLRNSADMFSARAHMSSSSSGGGVSSTMIAADHPFGKELAELTEVAEEFNNNNNGPSPMEPEEQVEHEVKALAPTKNNNNRPPTMKQLPAEPTVWDEEREYISKHGLRMFSAEEYMAEIGSPFVGGWGGEEEVMWL